MFIKNIYGSFVKKKKEERNENEIKEGYKQQLDFINDPRTTFCEAVEKLIFHEES